MAIPSASNKTNKTKHTTLCGYNICHLAITSATCCKQLLLHLPLGKYICQNVVLTSTTTSGNNISLENKDHHINYGNNICHLALTPANCCNMWPFHLPLNKQYLLNVVNIYHNKGKNICNNVGNNICQCNYNCHNIKGNNICQGIKICLHVW